VTSRRETKRLPELDVGADVFPGSRVRLAYWYLEPVASDDASRREALANTDASDDARRPVA
jgi:hypothetical protein